MRDALKATALGIATVAVVPSLLSFAIRSIWLGRNRALEGSSQALSLVPGVLGDYLRRAFLGRVLAQCDSSATIQFGTIFSQAGARIEANVYIGPGCHLGLVHLEKDVLVAAGVHIPSGGATHGIGDVDKPIREQPGARSVVRIGQGTWIGSASVVFADVGPHSVVGAGSVVTSPLPEYVIAAGSPARVIRDRRSEARP
jgi:virginiamycin A acetyltransferase